MKFEMVLFDTVADFLKDLGNCGYNCGCCIKGCNGAANPPCGDCGEYGCCGGGCNEETECLSE